MNKNGFSDGLVEFGFGFMILILFGSWLFAMNEKLNESTVDSCRPAYIITTEGQTYISDTPIEAGSVIGNEDYRKVKARVFVNKEE